MHTRFRQSPVSPDLVPLPLLNLTSFEGSPVGQEEIDGMFNQREYSAASVCKTKIRGYGWKTDKK